MPDNQLLIDDATILDNIDERVVEFTAEVDGDEYEFALQYDVLEALSGDAPDGDAIETFNRFNDAVAEASLAALSRNRDATPIVVSENDLE